MNHNRRVLRCFVIRLLIPLMLMMVSAFFISCSTKKKPPVQDQNIVYLEKEVSEANKKIEELYHRLSVIQFMVDNHEKAIRDMEKTTKPQSPTKKPQNTLSKSVSGTGAVSQSPVQNSNEPAPEVIYNLARNAYNSQNYGEAEGYFYQFIQKYPDHELADNATYWRGESLYAQKKFTDAIQQFQHLIDRYPNGSKVPDALLKTGYAFLSIKDTENGRKYLKLVTRNYPFSPAASKAAEMLKNIK